MKKIFFSTIATIASVMMFGLATTASADCMEEGSCFDNFQQISIGGSANFGGIGAGQFSGEDGGVLIEKEGYGSTDTTLNIGGDLCGADCQDGSFSFNAEAGEWISIMSGAQGTTPDETVSVINEGGVFSGADFQFGTRNVTNDGN